MGSTLLILLALVEGAMTIDDLQQRLIDSCRGIYASSSNLLHDLDVLTEKAYFITPLAEGTQVGLTEDGRAFLRNHITLQFITAQYAKLTA